MILTRLFLFLAAVGIAAAAPGNPDLEPEKNGPLKDILKSFTGLANAVFQIRLRPEDKPNPTVEFDTPKDCKGKFPEFYRTRSGMMINVLCLRDHPGGDFATLWVKSWTICAEVCSWKSGCIAFSFEGVDKKGTNCWLKKKIHQVPPKSPHVWAGVVVRLQDIPESKRKQWESYIGPRQTDVPPPEPYRPWFSTDMPKLNTPEPKTTMMTSMVKKGGSGLMANEPGVGMGGPEITLSDLGYETGGLITDGPMTTSKPSVPVIKPIIGPGAWGFAFDSSFIAKLKSQVSAIATSAGTTTWRPTDSRHNNAPPTGTVAPAISAKSTSTPRAPPPPPPQSPSLPPPPPGVAAPTPVIPAIPAVPAIPAQSTGVATVPAAVPGAWVVPKVQGSILDCYNCGWEAPRAALPRAIEFFCRGGQNQSYGSLWKNDTVFSSAPLGLMYWSKEIPLLRFLVTAHLNSSVHLKQPGFKERCVDNLSRAMNQCDEGSKNGTTRGGFVIDDMARWGIDPQPQTRVTECEWHTGNGTEDPWCSTWHKEPAAARYDMVTVDCPLATAALHY